MDNPKSKEDLEKQIKDNMAVSTGQYAGSIAKGTAQAAVEGTVLTGALMAGSALVDYSNAIGDATIVRSAENATHSGMATLIDKGKLSENLAKAGLPEKLDWKSAWKYTKDFARNNKTTIGIAAALAVVGAVIYSWLNIKEARQENDKNIGEAYRYHKIQFGHEPFSEPPVSKDKAVVGKFTGQLAQEQADKTVSATLKI